MEFSGYWFLFFFGLIYVGWLIWVLLTEGTDGLKKRLKKEPKPVAFEAPAAAPKSSAQVTAPRRHDARPGFRDVRWGDPPAPTMSLLQREGDSELFMRGDDKLRYGKARLLRMNYQFWRGRLSGIVMQVAPDNLDQALDELVQEYGKFSQSKDNPSRYVWLGTGEKATQVIVDADLEKLSATVIMMSKAIADERKAAGLASQAVLPAVGGAAPTVGSGPIPGSPPAAAPEPEPAAAPKAPGGPGGEPPEAA